MQRYHTTPYPQEPHGRAQRLLACSTTIGGGWEPMVLSRIGVARVIYNCVAPKTFLLGKLFSDPFQPSEVAKKTTKMHN